MPQVAKSPILSQQRLLEAINDGGYRYTSSYTNYPVTKNSSDAGDPLRGECDWIANTEGGTQPNVNLNPDTPYKIEFIKSSSPTRSIFYMQCTTAVDRTKYGFHCPLTEIAIGTAFQRKNDIYIDYDVQSGTIDLWAESLGPIGQSPSYNDFFGDNNWLLPHNRESYCQARNCSSSLPDYFVAAQFPASIQTGPFSLTAKDITILSGLTWDFHGVTLKFPSSKKLVNNGTLYANGTTFTASGTSWSGLYFASGSNGVLASVIVDKAQSYGGGAIHINNASPTIWYSTIKNCSGACSGIYVSNGSPFLYRNTIQGNTTHGISLYNSSTSIVQNNITANTTSGNAAVRCDYYSTPLFGYASSPYFEGRNTLTGAYYGVYAEDNATCHVGVSSSLAYNNRFLSNTYDAYTSGSGAIVAKYAWWGEYPPTVSQIVGNVTYSSYLSSDPGDAFKAGGEMPVVIVAPNDLLVQAIELRHQGDYSGAISLLQQILSQAPDVREGQRVLIELGQIERARRDGTLLGLLNSHAQLGSPLRVVAMEVLLGLYAEAGDVASAEEIIEILLHDYAGTNHALNARLMQFYLHLDSGDLASARALLAELELEDVADESVKAARWLLYLEGVVEEPRVSQVEPIIAEASNSKNAEGMTLSVVSYPNPFNPVTMIRYELPKADAVKLVVYDVLGRAVATLAEGLQEAGTHEVAFEASRLPSGPYVYRLEVGGAVHTGTMLLLK